MHKISTVDFQEVLKSKNVDSDNDTENCALVSPLLFENQKTAFFFCSLLEKSTSRTILCLPCEYVPNGCIYVKEDVYFNICKHFGKDNTIDTLNFNIEECKRYANDNDKPNDFSITAIKQTSKILAEDSETLLSTYFSKKRFLYPKDLIAIPLSKTSHLSKSYTNYNIDCAYFIVNPVRIGNGNQEGAYYQWTEKKFKLAEETVSPLPAKAQYNITHKCTDDVALYSRRRISPDLSKYIAQLTRLFKPFLRDGSKVHTFMPLFLLSGLQGSGKMKTLRATAEELGMHLLTVKAFDCFGISVDLAEKKFVSLFEAAANIGPCIMAITEFELIGVEKNGKEDTRVMSLFLECLKKSTESPKYPLIVVGITNSKYEDMLPSISRAVLRLVLFTPSKGDEVLETVCWILRNKGFTIAEEDLKPILSKLVGFVHADLHLLVDHAVRIMYKEKEEKDVIQPQHVQEAIALMEAAYSDSIGAAKVPNVNWDDVGGLTDIKEEVKFTLNMPLRRPGLMGSKLRRSGLLFYGPPGTGKTLMAKAVATECSMNFLSVKGPELMNMYVGQSEKNVREVFARGRAAAPCIVFFDELDSLAPNRGKSGDGGGVTDRVVSQLLAEMDGLESNNGLFVIGATNRPDLVDPALLRPGRFDKMFYLGACHDEQSKIGVLKALTKKFILAPDVDLKKVVSLFPSHVTGADVYSICTIAWLAAARRQINKMQETDIPPELPLKVGFEDFEVGVKESVPSLTEEDIIHYELLALNNAARS